MTNQELLPLVGGKAGLWLAAIAACAGLALAWWWWLSRRMLRNRALQALGFTKPVGSATSQGVRLAGVITVAIVTIFFLTPTTPGVGDTEPAVQVVTPAATEPTSEVVVVEVRSDGAIIMVRGSVVEIRLAPAASTPAAAGSQANPGGNTVSPKPTSTPADSALPENME